MGVVVELVCGIALYFFSSLGGVSIVKFLNYRFAFSEWLVFALVSRSTWLLSLPLHWLLQFRQGLKLGVTMKQLQLYFIIALALSAVEVLNAFTMTALPGSLYALLKGSDVAWSMALSVLILKKQYPATQVIAAILIMTGISLVFVLGPPSASEEKPVDSGGSRRAELWSAGEEQNFGEFFNCILCVLAAMLNSLCSVWTEGALKSILREEQEKLLQSSTAPTNDGVTAVEAPSKLLLSNAYSMWTSFFTFVLLLVSVAVGSFWRDRQSDNSHDDSDGSSAHLQPQQHPGGPTWTLWLCLLLFSVGLSRFLERLSKYWICVCDSAMTFSVVQAARRLAGVYILAALFAEPFPPSMLVGSLCSAAGFALHWHGGRTRASSSSTSSTGGNQNGDRKGDTHSYELVVTQPDSGEGLNKSRTIGN